MRTRYTRPGRPSHRPPHLGGIEISVLCSIYNAPGNERAELLHWGLKYLQKQDFPPETWEVVLVDDLSDRDISPAYEPLLGKINITHVKMDHRCHPIWKEMNPKRFTSIEEENWPHTPALSTNLAVKQAQGRVLCFSQPEICASPNSFKRGYQFAREDKCFVFTELVLTPPKFREQFMAIGEMVPFPQFWNQAIASLEGEDPVEYKAFHSGENYWMYAFLEKRWFMAVRGVDEEFQRGVYAEDDNFRNRIEMIGVKTFRDRNSHAVHLNTKHEIHKKQQRDQEPWLTWAKVNRERQSRFLKSPQTFGGPMAN